MKHRSLALICLLYCCTVPQAFASGAHTGDVLSIVRECCADHNADTKLDNLLQKYSDSELGLRDQYSKGNDVYKAFSFAWQVITEPPQVTFLDVVRVRARYICPNNASTCKSIDRKLTSRNVRALVETHPTEPQLVPKGLSWTKNPALGGGSSARTEPSSSKPEPCSTYQAKIKNAVSGTLKNGECVPDTCRYGFDKITTNGNIECKPKCKNWEHRVNGVCVQNDCSPADLDRLNAATGYWTNNTCKPLKCLDGSNPQNGTCPPVNHNTDNQTISMGTVLTDASQTVVAPQEHLEHISSLTTNYTNITDPDMDALQRQINHDQNVNAGLLRAAINSVPTESAPTQNTVTGTPENPCTQQVLDAMHAKNGVAFNGECSPTQCDVDNGYELVEFQCVKTGDVADTSNNDDTPKKLDAANATEPIFTDAELQEMQHNKNVAAGMLTAQRNAVPIDPVFALTSQIDTMLSRHFSGSSVWKNQDGKFNTARLASDSVAGVVLGTVGGVVTSTVMKKKQAQQGFEKLKCTIGGQDVASYGDEFFIGLSTN